MKAVVLTGSACATGGWTYEFFAGVALKTAARFWFLVAVAGQWIFAYYMVATYVSPAVQGNLAAWNKDIPHRYVPGDTVGNSAFALHLLLAAIITFGGPLQLIPQIRTRAATFHRWIGRIYLPASFTAGIAGLYLMWIRGTVGSFSQHLGLSLDAVLIMLCAAMAFRYARARQFAVHRRWALRLFLVVSGVWFFRVGLMFWIFVNHGPVGFDPQTFEGPFIDFLSFAISVLPLSILELYLRTLDRGVASTRIAMAASLLILSVAMGIGIYVATMGMWLPRLR